MIILHKSLKRSEELARSIRRKFECDGKAISGVMECFNNKDIQGYLLKIYHSFNKNNDLVIWLYESLKEKNIQVAYSTLSNVDEFNNWIDKEKLNIKEYPIIKEIKKDIVSEVFNNIINYYGLDERIEEDKSLKI